MSTAWAVMVEATWLVPSLVALARVLLARRTAIERRRDQAVLRCIEIVSKPGRARTDVLILERVIASRWAGRDVRELAATALCLIETGQDGEVKPPRDQPNDWGYL